MKTTFNSILNSMKTAYFEQTGENVALYSELDARFNAVASELYSLCVYNDFILKQAFAQTASGSYLDFHAELRDISRKSASKAEGELTFYINEPSENSVEIPQGTVCSAKGMPYIQFETTNSGIINVGETQVTVKAAACENGGEYNLKPNEICVMVTAPIGVSGVYNNNSFIGGNNEESDESLRKRILKSYSIFHSGFSRASMKEQLLKLDDILDASIVVYGEVYVYLVTKSGRISNELKNKIEDSLALSEILGITPVCEIALEREYSLSVDITCESGKINAVKEEAESYLSYLFARLKIEEALNLKKLAYELSKIDGVKFAEITSPQAYGGIIPSSKSECLLLSELEVKSHE